MDENKAFLGTGMKFPPQVDPITGKFKMVSEEEDIKEAVYIILMTNKRERAMNPEFGCNIQSYVLDLANTTYINLLKSEMIEALLRWEPRIDEVEMDVDMESAVLGKIVFQITYKVKATNTKGNMVFPYYLE